MNKKQLIKELELMIISSTLVNLTKQKPNNVSLLEARCLTLTLEAKVKGK